MTRSLISFEEFASKFVIEYWIEMKKGPPEFANHAEPIEETVEELLSEIEYSIPETGTLNMTHEIGEGWQFKFVQSGDRWKVVNFSAGPNSNLGKRNYFCSVYKPLFEPVFYRICQNVYTS